MLSQLDPNLEHKEELAQISFHALVGQLIPRTLCALGSISASPVQALVDGDSIHNFVQDCVAQFLGLELLNIDKFHMLVGNSDEIRCSHVCRKVPVKAHGHIFEVDLYIIPLSGADLALGIQWLL